MYDPDNINMKLAFKSLQYLVNLNFSSNYVYLHCEIQIPIRNITSGHL